MDVPQLKTQRKSLRTSLLFVRIKLTLSLERNWMSKQLSILKSQIRDKFTCLKLQRDITDLIFKDDDAENIYKEDFNQLRSIEINITS
ncbi:hypothetical protein NPIL_410151 [Nephila pilipes]|uniref:Uncharacterized protein n=1 Tax=Nephila pilipes TaxID=299642 RepID=A0A8X6NEC7_NEPPI|nr:hypothetical protein NPIL_410151 [Nephila pilipes]